MCADSLEEVKACVSLTSPKTNDGLDHIVIYRQCLLNLHAAIDLVYNLLFFVEIADDVRSEITSLGGYPKTSVEEGPG